MNRLILIFLGAWCTASAWAQEGNAPPTPPFFTELPQNAAWKVTFDPHDKTPAAPVAAPPVQGSPLVPANLKEEDFSRYGDDMRVVKTWSDGTTTQEWRYQGVILFTQRGTPQIYVMGRSSLMTDVFPTMSDSAFPELAWITVEKFTSVGTMKDKTTNIFEEQGLLGVAKPGKIIEGHSAHQAWIDRTTHLPVAFDDGMALRTYDFTGSPPGPLALPPDFAETLEKFRRATAHLHHERMNL